MAPGSSVFFKRFFVLCSSFAGHCVGSRGCEGNERRRTVQKSVCGWRLQVCLFEAEVFGAYRLVSERRMALMAQRENT